LILDYSATMLQLYMQYSVGYGSLNIMNGDLFSRAVWHIKYCWVVCEQLHFFR